MASPPTPKNIRLTISVTPEVHAVFEHLAEAGGMSMSRAMGEWLADTSEAAGQLAAMLQRARAAPKTMARELHSFALGLTDETQGLIDRARDMGKQDRAGVHAQRAPLPGPAASPPRPVIRGGKSTTTGSRRSL
jgi:hypothetical protein